MNKRIKMLLLALICVVFVCAALVACTKETPPEEAAAPSLTVSSQTVTGKVRTEITLPTATAQDEKDGDLTSAIRIKIMFRDDDIYVLPTSNVNEGVALSEYPSYTPSKVGTYEITYFVTNAASKQATETVTMTVTENTDDVLGQNLIGKDQLENWIVGESTQNGIANEYGEIELARNGMAFAGAVYKGRKIQNGDTVSVAFRANPTKEVMFYNIAFLLTPNSDKDAPVAEEGNWPKYYNIRFSSSSMTAYLVTDNNVNFDMFEQMNVNLCDGKTHTISLNIEANENSVTSKIWVDKATDTTPSQMTTKYKADVLAKYGDDTENVKIFSSDITGWLSFGANILGDTSNDGLILRALTINNESMIAPPELNVGEFSSMILQEEVALPQFTARDSNDYSDITDRVIVSVKEPGSEEFAVLEDTSAFLPESVGEYVFKYVVTDRSGNTEYQTYEVDCSKGVSTEAPEITFDADVQDTYTVQVNTEFAFPVPVSVTDSFGDDISSRLNISLTGREKASLNGESVYVFRAIGDNTLRYEVTDYSGNTTVKEITVTVEGDESGNILENEDDFYLGSGMSIDNGMLNIKGGGSSVVYGKNKIYEEKVSILMNFGLASTAGGTDGSNIVLINLRGGKQLTKVPLTGNAPDGVTDFNWPTGLTLLMTTFWGITLKADGYDGSDLANAILDKSMQEIFRDKTTLLSYQLTDEYADDGTFEGVRFRLWINDMPISFSSSFAMEDGSVLLTPRVINTNENIMQAGWFSMYLNDGVETNIYSITIDGSRPHHTSVTFDKETDQSFEVGQEYVLPVCTLSVDGEDLSSQVKKFIWIDNQAQPDLSGEGYAQASIVPGKEHAKGFTVLYVYEGEIIGSIHVVNASLGSEILFEQDAYAAKIGEAFALPKFAATYDGSDVTSEVVVKLKVGYIEKEVQDTTYTPTISDNFTLNYYLYDALIASKEVTVSGGVAKDHDLTQDGHTTGGKAWAYTNQQIYNNTVVLKFRLAGPLNPGGWVDFGLRGNAQDAGDWFSYMSGLVLRLEYNAQWGIFFKVGYGGTDGWFDAAYGESTLQGLRDLDWTQEHTLAYSIYDVYEDGEFVGIRFEMWFDGEAVQFKDMNNAGYTSTSDGTYILIPADYVRNLDKNEEIFCPSYLFVWSKDQDVSQPIILEAYIMGPGEYVPA